MKLWVWLALGLWLACLGTTRAEIAGDVVRLGVLTDDSGTFADGGGKGSLEAARLAVAEFGGTVRGKKIEVLYADHQNKADVGVAIARQWFDVENVSMITDLLNSSVALGVQGLARERDRVLLPTGASTTELTGRQCSPNTIHYAYDTYAFAKGTGASVVASGGDSWFFITADFAFGQSLERETTGWVLKSGGKIVGGVKAPLGTTDFSSYLLQAKASGAKVIALANAGEDAVNAIKQAGEFGVTQGGQRLVALFMDINDINALGLKAAQGLTLTAAFYWDRTEATRAFATRFEAKVGRPPSMVQAGVYSAVGQYLKAVDAIDSTKGRAVVERMRATRIHDVFADDGYVREDGRMVHDMYLVEVKKPEAQRHPWDYFRIVKTIPGEEAFRPLAESDCPLVRKSL